MLLCQQLPANTGDDAIHALANGNHASKWPFSAMPACDPGKSVAGQARDTYDFATQARTRLNEGMQFVENRVTPLVNMKFGLV